MTQFRSLQGEENKLRGKFRNIIMKQQRHLWSVWFCLLENNIYTNSTKFSWSGIYWKWKGCKITQNNDTIHCINPFLPNVPLMEKLSSWFLPANVGKNIFETVKGVTHCCDISTPLARDVFKRKLYKDRWTKVYLASVLSWVRFHVTSVHHFYKEGCPCVSLKRFHPPDLIIECPRQT